MGASIHRSSKELDEICKRQSQGARTDMTAGQLWFMIYIISIPFILLFGGMYGDYKAGERYMIFWKKKEKGVNSGAKFG